MFRSIAIIFALCLVTATAQAALLGRAPATAGGTDYQAYYDTSTSLTWAADANLAATNTFGVSGIYNDQGGSGIKYSGYMDWNTAQAWIAGMNASNTGAGYLGVNNWRLPTVTDTGAPGCDYAHSGTDCGYNVDLSTGEMARMFYGTLGNTSDVSPSGVLQSCPNTTSLCLTNAGPFSNLEPDYYWSGTEYAPDTSSAWYFIFSNGRQADAGKIYVNFHAWAVAPGDPLNTIPLPPAAFLFPCALGLLGLRRRLG